MIRVYQITVWLHSKITDKRLKQPELCAKYGENIKIISVKGIYNICILKKKQILDSFKHFPIVCADK